MFFKVFLQRRQKSSSCAKELSWVKYCDFFGRVENNAICKLIFIINFYRVYMYPCIFWYQTNSRLPPPRELPLGQLPPLFIIRNNSADSVPTSNLVCVKMAFIPNSKSRDHKYGCTISKSLSLSSLRTVNRPISGEEM